MLSVLEFFSRAGKAVGLVGTAVSWRVFAEVSPMAGFNSGSELDLSAPGWQLLGSYFHLPC